MNQRHIAEAERKHKAIKGESGSLHQRGNEEIDENHYALKEMSLSRGMMGKTAMFTFVSM